ncbi:type IV pilin protein [Agarivorans sp. B2Z047]|nr:type IV pilin protein [Agarivorans sp. B2Z047]
MQTTKREEAKRTLVEAAQQMESYYAMHLSYASAATGTSLSIYTPSSEFNEIYTLTADNVSSSGYKLTATPKGSQVGDSCGNLSLSSTGLKEPTTGGCW